MFRKVSQIIAVVLLAATTAPLSAQAQTSGNNSNGSCELYDPASPSWAATGSLNHPMRNNFPITLLSNGRALIVGGYYDWWSGEIYTP